MATTRIISMHVSHGKTIADCLTDRIDYSKNPEKTQIPRKTAQTALRVLSRVGAVHLTGKRGRMNLYGSKPVQMSE